MRVCHGFTTVFDDPNLVSCAGLAPVLQLAERAGLQRLVGVHVELGKPGGVYAHLKVHRDHRVANVPPVDRSLREEPVRLAVGHVRIRVFDAGGETGPGDVCRCPLSARAPPSTLRRMEGGVARPLAQLRRGVLEYCVLSLLSEQQLYGFDLVRRLSEVDGMIISEGTIYPLLSRLRRQGWVTTRWVESDAGPPRRYYGLTQDGQRALQDFAGEWQRFRDAVDHLMPGGSR